MKDDLPLRLDGLRDRLRTSYDGIGHSSGRPYVYFVYPPERERELRRLAGDSLRSDADLHFYAIDLLPLTVSSLVGQEEKRQETLAGPLPEEAAQGILRRWAGALVSEINAKLAEPERKGRPVVVLYGLAALHPLGNPTSFMERLAEQEPRDPATNQMVPIVLLVPGIRPPQTSREYLFLGLERLDLSFYRGEEA